MLQTLFDSDIILLYVRIQIFLSSLLMPFVDKFHFSRNNNFIIHVYLNNHVQIKP